MKSWCFVLFLMPGMNVLAQDRTVPAALAQYVREAKENHVSSVSIPPQSLPGPAYNTTDEAAPYYDIVEVEPALKKSYVTPAGLICTVYEFKVLETIHSHTAARTLTSDASSYAAELFPVPSDAIVVPVPGGVVTVDGITLTQMYPITELDMKGKYVVFVAINSRDRTGVLGGMNGIFRVLSGGRLASVVEAADPLTQEVTDHENGIRYLSSHLKPSK